MTVELSEILTEKGIVNHLTPVEQRLYRSSSREAQLQTVFGAKVLNPTKLIVDKAVELGHPIENII